MREINRKPERMALREHHRQQNNLRPEIRRHLLPRRYSLGLEFDDPPLVSVVGSPADKRKADYLAASSTADDAVRSKRSRLGSEHAGGDINFETETEFQSNYPPGWTEKETSECVKIFNEPLDILDLLKSSNFNQHIVSSSYVDSALHCAIVLILVGLFLKY